MYSLYPFLSTFWGLYLLMYQTFSYVLCQSCTFIPTYGTSRWGLVSFIWVFPFSCTVLYTLRGLGIYAIYFLPYYSPCCHCYFRCYSFMLFIYSELYIVPVLTCHWLRQLNKPMANGWYMASLTLQDSYPVLQLVYEFWGRYSWYQSPKFLLS